MGQAIKNNEIVHIIILYFKLIKIGMDVFWQSISENYKFVF